MTERAFLQQVLLGDAEAVAFVEMLGLISQTWDDLVDGCPPSAEMVNAAFWNAVVGLPSNEFYRAHFATLQPLLQTAIADWLDSNTLEKGDTHDKHIAFILRDSATSIVVQCARLVGGYAHMRKVGPDIRRYFMDERLEKFMEERE